MTPDKMFRIEDGLSCEEMNPKELMLYAAAKCSCLTAMRIMQKERVVPRRLEVSYSGEVSEEALRQASVFSSFHVVYNVACDSGSDQSKASRAIVLTHDRYCGMTQMLRRVAPISREIAIVSVEPTEA